MGQRIVIGDRAPELKAHSWLTAKPNLDGKSVMVEFFHSTNKYSVSRLRELDRLARSSNGKLAVVVVTREHDPKVKSLITNGGPAYYAMLDDAGKTFTAYGTKFVPYAVIYDRKGRVIWLGNPTSLTNEDIIKML